MPIMIVWCVCVCVCVSVCVVLKVRVKCEYESVEIRWKLWLREKVILVRETDGGDVDSWEYRGYGTK